MDEIIQEQFDDNELLDKSKSSFQITKEKLTKLLSHLNLTKDDEIPFELSYCDEDVKIVVPNTSVVYREIKELLEG